MQNMGSAMVAHGLSSLQYIYQRIDGIAHLKFTFSHFTLVTKYISLNLESILNRKAHAFIA